MLTARKMLTARWSLLVEGTAPPLPLVLRETRWNDQIQHLSWTHEAAIDPSRVWSQFVIQQEEIRSNYFLAPLLLASLDQ